MLSQVESLCQRGHRVTIFRPRPGKRYREKVVLPKGASIEDVPFTLPAPRLPELRLVFPTILTSYKRLKRLRPDVVHVHTEWGCGWEGMFAAKLLKVPVVGTFHTFFADPGYLESLRLPTWKIIQSSVWRYAVSFFNQCDAVTSPSEAVRQSLLDHGVRKDPLLISNGIRTPPPISPQAIADLRRDYHIHGPSFVYVGRIAPEKSLDVLIRAFRRVANVIPDAKLVLIGDGPSRESIDALIDELHLNANVVRLGFVPHKELIERNLLLLGDAFVTPSKTENQPVSVLEAMAAGLPIIGARAKGLIEMINHGDNGYQFTPDDIDEFASVMFQFTEPDTPVECMSTQAKQYAKQHSLASSIDKLEALYSELVYGTNVATPAVQNSPEHVESV